MKSAKRIQSRFVLGTIDRTSTEMIETDETSAKKMILLGFKDRLKIKVIDRPLGKDGLVLDPVLPRDLTQLNDTKLGVLYSEFSLMAQYVQLQIALLAVDKAVDQRRLKVDRARVALEKKGRVIDVAPLTEVDPRTRAAEFRALVSEGQHTLSKAAMEVYVIGRETCSREMTRRGLTRDDPVPRR